MIETIINKALAFKTRAPGLILVYDNTTMLLAIARVPKKDIPKNKIWVCIPFDPKEILKRCEASLILDCPVYATYEEHKARIFKTIKPLN